MATADAVACASEGSAGTRLPNPNGACSALLLPGSALAAFACFEPFAVLCNFTRRAITPIARTAIHMYFLILGVMRLASATGRPAHSAGEI